MRYINGEYDDEWLPKNSSRILSRVVMNVVGVCFVKIQGNATENCGSLPKNTWFNDNEHGGNLGDSATYAACSARGWASYCGTAARYAIRQVVPCQGDSNTWNSSWGDCSTHVPN